jgi:hypothetical protein
MEHNDQDNQLVFSLISGYNSYIVPTSQYDKPFYGTHEPSHAMVRLVPVYQNSNSSSNEMIEKYRQIILWPMPQMEFEWPVDIVEVPSQEHGVLCLVYPQLGFPKMESMRSLLYQPIAGEILDWRRPRIQRLCINFMKRMDHLDRSGYLYRCFDINQIYFDEKSNIFFGFSPELTSKEWDQTIQVKKLPMEFTLPEIYGEHFNGKYPIYGDNYSAAAILFRMMIGRLPYEGSGLMAFGTVFDPDWDTDPGAHEDYFRHYVQFPHFIFDEKDQSNPLGVRTSDNGPRERWNTLPEDIRDMFRQVLGQETAEGKMRDEFCYTPAKWIEALHRCFEGE